uniref:Type IV secretion protein VirB8 n=1 Tax=Ochrobactrum sp. LM19 TaxID=1449781 RepID=A0A0D5A116_9HYPH|nr:type IV secretion system protein [Ochrobactrum sp. LM19]AJW30005.1 type IV secretion protein VirB8 [Ochrobactrum sp. LM19]
MKLAPILKLSRLARQQETTAAVETTSAAVLETANANSPVVDPRYYQEALQWEASVYRGMQVSRNIWRGVSLLMGATTLTAIGLLWWMLPLKTFDVVVLEVDRATGYVEASRPLEESGELTENEAVLRANIVRYLRARETYDPKSLNDNFQLASLYSTGIAANELAALYALSNPQNPMKVLGADSRISVRIASISFPNAETAFVRFSTVRKTPQGQFEDHWVGQLRFRYTSEPMKNQWRFDNPLGFQVTEYRKDQETVRPKVTPNMTSGGAS